MKSSSSSSNGNVMKDRGRTLPVDPNLPRYLCQNCRNYICFVGVESYTDKYFAEVSRSGTWPSSSMHGASSGVSASTRMDNSFVVLAKQNTSGVPLRPRPGGAQPENSQAGKAMEESFVVLPPLAASVYKSESTSDGPATNLPLSGGPSDAPVQQDSSGFHSTITVLNRAFDIAKTQTPVDLPVCLECMRLVSDKLDKEVEDVNKDIQAYEDCLERMEGESKNSLSQTEFLKEKVKIEEEERKLQAAIEETEKQYADVNAQLRELELKSGRFKELEERYWQEFNNFQFQLLSHQEEKEAILAKFEVSQAHLDLLKRTNVLNDAFPITNDGDFGTINNFRLGRLPKIPVEWDEINAAWGQACLLLHTMAKYFHQKFRSEIKILPMGSYPRIVDASNNIYELFGPVNLFWSTRYDKAMLLFLTCLNDFAEFARATDKENKVSPEKCFKLPYKIENDKVESYSITQSFNKQENWTKALKYALCNLKWVLYWFIGKTSFRPLPATVSSDEGARSLYNKRPTDAEF